MIDGIKIECVDVLPDAWRGNAALQYFPRVDVSTGEVIPQTLAAYYQGLAFKIRPSRERPDCHYLEIVGSLHRYHTKGGHNAGDFTRAHLAAVIQELAECFQVNPQRSPLRGLEFGVNIELPGTADDFLKGLICMPDKKFTRMNVDRPALGRVCSRAEYEVKIYNKAAQADLSTDNLLRVELRVKKMRWLTKCGISCLADLLEPDNLQLLGRELLATLAEVVFYDSSIVPGTLTPRERQKLEEYTNPHRWAGYTKDQRYKAKKGMLRFFAQHGGNAPQWGALFQVGKKWLQLAELPQEKGDDFTAYFQQLAADKKAMISPLECRVKRSLLDSINSKGAQEIEKGRFSTITADPNTPQNQRTFCAVCSRDISHQKTGSRFCSEKHFGRKARRCRDRAYGQARTTRRRAAREAEHLAALQLLELLPVVSVELSIYWNTNHGPHVATLLTPGPLVWPDLTTARIYKITAQVLPAGSLQEYTSTRARLIVKELSNLK